MKTGRIHTVITETVILLFALICVIPFLWVIISAFKEGNDVMMHPFSLPSDLYIKNFIDAWREASVGRFFINSLMVSAVSVAVILLSSSMISYVLARVTPNLGLFIYFTMGIMIPLQTIVIPIFVIIKGMNLLNTYWGLIIAYSASGLSFGVFVLTAFFKTLPKEMEEAAVIDGCTRTMIFFRIVFPLSKIGLATVGTFTFLQCWNEYLFASVLIAKTEYKTLTQGIMLLKGQYSTDYGLLCAGLTFAILPVLMTFILLQKQVIKGMMAGAIKG